MTDENYTLTLYDEILLLALRDEDGTKSGQHIRLRIGAALAAELILLDMVRLDGNRMIPRPVRPDMSDPILREARRNLPTDGLALKKFLKRQSKSRSLVDAIAGNLCDRGILEASSSPVLFFWEKTVYPTINPGPEADLKARIKAAVQGDNDPDTRTACLIALAGRQDLLVRNFGKDWIKQYKTRIESITDGIAIADAVQKIIKEAEAALLMLTVTTTVVTTMN